jgi:hypothetical protein
MPGSAKLVVSPKTFLHGASALVLGGLIVALPAGCDNGSGRDDQELAARAATQTCVGGPRFDPAGAKNVGNGRGQQFIGGQCLKAADCASGCCALPCGICSGPGAQFQAGKQGCGFGDAKAPGQSSP